MNGLNQKASEFPDSPGVYRFFKNKKILYIGKAKSLKKRVKTYFGKSLKEFKTQKLVNQITGMDFIETNNILLFGSEGYGLKKHTEKYTDFSVKIKINKNVESLNISNSAAIVFHYINQQK